jgi:4-hydroxy-tetrahydrodipicolinate reductase
MKIILFGYGNMGKTIEKLALKRGHEILLKVNSENAGSIKAYDLKGADVAIEFTKPETAYKNVMLCFEANIPVVCGTTGWSDKLVVVEDYCRQNHQSLFYASNFSLGVNLFYEINLLLAKLMNAQPQYDEILIHESHHKGKLDSPSGTAISLAGQVLSQVKRFKQWVNYKTDENVNLDSETEGELPIFSTREDGVTGTHIVKYFSDVDEIEIMHKALNRDGFVSGAISAAEWIIDKKGVFGMKDLLKL